MSDRLKNLRFGDIVGATVRFRPFLGLLLAILLVTVVLPLKPTASGNVSSRGPVFGDEQQQEALAPTSETTEVPPEAFVAPGALYSPEQFTADFYATDLSSSEDLEDRSDSGSDSAGDQEEEEEEEEPAEEPSPEPSPIACIPGVACVTPAG